MVVPLIVIGSNGSLWSDTRVLERIGDAMRLCGSTCASGVAPSIGGTFPRRCWRRYAEADLSRHVSEDVPSFEDGLAQEAVCVWSRALRAVARNASDAEIRSHSGHDLGRMDEVARDLLIPTTRSRDCLPFRLDLAR
jgi:hypothetical protein